MILRVGLFYLRVSPFYLRLVFVAYGQLAWSFLLTVWSFLLTVEISGVKITGFCKMPLFIFVVFARFQALTAKFRQVSPQHCLKMAHNLLIPTKTFINRIFSSSNQRFLGGRGTPTVHLKFHGWGPESIFHHIPCCFPLFPPTLIRSSPFALRTVV